MGNRSKTSRKGKKAWRANISTEDIEDFFEKSTKDALSGGNLSAAPSEDLFHVDKSHDIPVKRKIEKHREKALRCDGVLKKNPFVQVVSSSKPKSKISKKKTNVVESKTFKQAQKNVDDGSVMMDLWGDDDNNNGEHEKNPRKIWKMTSSIPAVEVDPAGCSYNPTAESHEDMLAEAVAQEMQKVYKNELGPEPVPLTIDGNNNIEDEAGLLSVCNRIINGKSAYFLGVDNGSEGEEEADAEKESSEAGNNKNARTTKRVTRVVLNKRSRQKALRKMETKEKLKEKLSKEIDSLPKILKEIAKDDKEKQNKLIRRKIAKEEVLKIRPPRLGKHKFEAPPVQVLLTEEMTGSLRKLKACCTLARDRFKSLEKRGILVPSKNIRWYKALTVND
ncbi:BnaC04g01280D [Brassica napus]|uniref:Ribosome biogenesis protein NOP53 n=2 Tax=Brassica napus TaxID=3708 RepID=A0A078GEZ7_BRANA|nr:BnaC04g01280D [Brassica napus]